MTCHPYWSTVPYGFDFSEALDTGLLKVKSEPMVKQEVAEAETQPAAT